MNFASVLSFLFNKTKLNREAKDRLAMCSPKWAREAGNPLVKDNWDYYRKRSSEVIEKRHLDLVGVQCTVGTN